MSLAAPAYLNRHDNNHHACRQGRGGMIAHVGGAPIEELLPLLASGGAATAVAVNAAVRAALRRARRRVPWSRSVPVERESNS